jgi:hypothetical protein
LLERIARGKVGDPLHPDVEVAPSIKASGFGPHEQGRAALEFYTETVTLYIDP